MPTPIDVLLDPLSLGFIALYAAMIAWEALAPARPLPDVPGWRGRGLIAFVAFFYLSSYLPLAWGEMLARHQLFDLTALGTYAGAAAGLVVYELFVYAWHRSMHASTALWRGLHQMHHSAERLDTFGAFWFGPLDMIGWTALSSLALTLVVGVTSQAATAVMLATSFMNMFQHANVRTPRWLGYVVQRPESHSHHHGRGIHAGNYADLPLIDLIFGTLHNPDEFVREQGFYDGASRRVADMLRFRDVSQPVGRRLVSRAPASVAAGDD